MGRSSETYGKKDVKKKQEKRRKDKEARKQERKEQGKKSFDDMIAYVDEHGRIVETPPDLSQKEEIEVEDIEIGIPKADSRVNTKLRRGRVNTFDESKGFGFISDSGSRDSIFVHANDCIEPIATGAQVEYETEKGPKGLKAIKVKPV